MLINECLTLATYNVWDSMRKRDDDDVNEKMVLVSYALGLIEDVYI